MAIVSQKGWASDGCLGGVSDDEYARYMDDIDDARLLRHDRGSRPGRTIHPHPSFREKIEVDAKAKIDGLIEEAKKGNIKAQFLLGKEYAQRGELGQAVHWLKKVADLGAWPEAEAELSRVRQRLRPEVLSVHCSTSDVDFVVNPFLSLPRIRAFRIYEIQVSEFKKKFLLLVVRNKSGSKMETMGSILKETGHEIATEIFETEEEAKKYGLFVMRSWGRHITQEREEKWNISKTIVEFMSALQLKKTWVQA